MRVRQKLTAVGACALATTAVLGGAAVTSHAMGESPTPDKGTMTVIAMTSDTDGAIKCVYDDIDLPAPPSGAGTEFTTQTGGAVQGHAEAIYAVSHPGRARIHGGLHGSREPVVNREPAAHAVPSASRIVSIAAASAGATPLLASATTAAASRTS